MARISAQKQVTEGASIQREARLKASLPDAVSGRVAVYERYQSLVRRAISVFGDEITASRWLSTPSADFDGEVPISVAQRNEYSLERFEPVFVRIEHGIYF